MRAVIVGCGIAGPALGMFLRRIGVDAVIREARPDDGRGEGAFLGVAPNGMNVLGELGVRAAIEAISTPCHAFEFRNGRDTRVGHIDRRGDGEVFGARLQMARRGALHQALTEAAAARGLDVRFGKKLVAIDRSDPARVIARFEDGSVEEGDLLVGCDGIRSATRRLALPDAPAPAWSGLVDFAGFVPGADAPLEPGVNVMVFGRRAFFGAFKTPAGEVWWFHNGGGPCPEHEARDAAAIRARVLAAHEGDPAWIRDLVDATPALLGPFPLHDILTMPRWHDGRVGLVGDAAHATTPSAGQGASLALEDTMVLAQCLRDLGSPERAFAAFERARRARVEAIVRQSRRISDGKVPGPVAGWFRDRMLPFFLRLGEKGQTESYGHRINWTTAMG